MEGEGGREREPRKVAGLRGAAIFTSAIHLATLFDLRDLQYKFVFTVHLRHNASNDAPLSLALFTFAIHRERWALPDSFAVLAVSDLIAASIYDKFSTGPSVRPVCIRCCFTMTTMFQVCSNFR